METKLEKVKEGQVKEYLNTVVTMDYAEDIQ